MGNVGKPQKIHRQPLQWHVMIVPVGTPEDGDAAQKRALEVIAQRYRNKHDGTSPQ